MERINVLECKEVSRFLIDQQMEYCQQLRSQGTVPTAAFIRVGNKRDDIAYQNNILKTCSSVGIEAILYELDDQADTCRIIELLDTLKEDKKIHGIMLFRPLPEHVDEEMINSAISSIKDVEGMNPKNMAKVFAGNYKGFAPCTAAAVMEILKYHDIKLKGKHAVILGRSMVVGKPLAMMLLQEDETVTVCHSKTKNLIEIAKTADVLVAAMGRPNAVGAEFIKPGAIVIDVGINVDQNGNICGDVKFDEAIQVASLVTPVPGGVGSVTTAVLIKNIIKAVKSSKAPKKLLVCPIK